MALLMGITAYLTRGKGNLQALLGDVRQSARLGPKMADWLAQNESRLRSHPLLQNADSGAAGGAPVASGNAKKSIKQETTARKGVFGEFYSDAYMQKNGFEKLDKSGRLTQLADDPAGPGIDSIWKNLTPPPDYVIVEAKFGQGSMGNTIDGRQMSDDWVSGAKTSYDRLESALGFDKAVAVRESLDAGKVEKWLLKVDASGNVSKKILDAAGYIVK